MTTDEICALNRLRAMMECGYIDISDDWDQDELWLIRRALDEYEENHKEKGTNEQ